MPYLYANAVKTHETGVPMMRAMVVDFSADPAALALDRQYMLGDNLLVAPVFNEEGICSFYLPDTGAWTDIQTGEVLEGGKWYEKKYDYFGMPLYAKPNSIIAYGDFKRNFTYDYVEGAKLVVYGLEDGKTAECKIYDENGKLELTVTAARNGDKIKVSSTGTSKKFTVESAQGLTVEM